MDTCGNRLLNGYHKVCNPNLVVKNHRKTEKNRKNDFLKSGTDQR